jgi:hypothetical protein
MNPSIKKLGEYAGVIISVIVLSVYLINYGAAKQADKDYDQEINKWRQTIDSDIKDLKAAVFEPQRDTNKFKPINH